MKNQPLWRISIRTTLEAEEAVAELLETVFDCRASAYFNLETQTSVV
jgi:hypothetical protein